MSRPRTSDPRNRQLNLSLTATELEGICRRAAAVGMRPVHFGRAVLLDPGRVPREADATTARLLYGQFVRLGNNLNQMMRHLHRTGGPVPPELAPLLADIREIIARVPQ